MKKGWGMDKGGTPEGGLGGAGENTKERGQEKKSKTAVPNLGPKSGTSFWAQLIHFSSWGTEIRAKSWPQKWSRKKPKKNKAKTSKKIFKNVPGVAGGGGGSKQRSQPSAWEVRF